MFWLVFIIIIVLLVCKFKGVFRKETICNGCGKNLKGTEQVWFRREFCLCKDCEKEIHPQIRSTARGNWGIIDYVDYKSWEFETKEERSKFVPEYSYTGWLGTLSVDTQHGLFRFDDTKKYEGLVYRFSDLEEYDLEFQTGEVETGVLSSSVSGNVFFHATMHCPNVMIFQSLGTETLPLKREGFIRPTYSYVLPENFQKVVQAFSICAAIEDQRRAGTYNQTSPSINELEKALALFMFDSMEDVTEDNLKKQRNALIKAFHPDNQETDDDYSKKINQAYEILHSMIKM